MEETQSPPPQAPSAPKDPPVTSMTHAPPPATHKKRPFKVHAEDKTCPKCGKVLQSRLALRVHLNRVYPCDQENVDSTKTCHKCGWKFATPAGLSLHLLKATPCDAPEAPAATRSEERAFKCGKCNEAFTSARSLLAHQSRVYACDDPTRTRTWQGGKTCPKCNKTFCSKQSLRLHLNRVTPCDAEKPSPGTAGGEKKAQTHPAGKKLHGCPGCQRRFATKHGLHVHMSRCPVASQLTKAQSAGAVEFRIAKQGEERSNATQMNVAIHVASVEPFSYSSNVSHGDATSVTDSSSCSSPSTEANGAECGKKDVPLSSTAVGVTSTSEAGNRKRNVDHGGEGLSPVEKSRKRVCTDAGTFAKLVARLPENGPSTAGNEKLIDDPTANKATASKATELLRETNCNHGGDILTDGCCCRPCVRKWARKMALRLENLADEVENLRGIAKTGASDTRPNLVEGSLDATTTGASMIQLATGDAKTKQETSNVMDISVDTTSDQDPGKISLLENYNHVNGQIIINERALEDSMAYLDKTCDGDELSNLEIRDQIDELRKYLNVAKGKRDKAVAAIIAHRWSARRIEFRLLLEKMTVKSKPDAEKVFHEECAEIADQSAEKDQAISELKARDNSKIYAELAAKALLERERDELFMRLLRSSRRIYLLAKETFVK